MTRKYYQGKKWEQVKWRHVSYVLNLYNDIATYEWKLHYKKQFLESGACK